MDEMTANILTAIIIATILVVLVLIAGMAVGLFLFAIDWVLDTLNVTLFGVVVT